MLDDAGVTDAEDILTLLDEFGVVVPLGELLEDPSVRGAEDIMPLLDETVFTAVGD